MGGPDFILAGFGGWGGEKCWSAGEGFRWKPLLFETYSIFRLCYYSTMVMV